jgi:hypothetical protein
MNKNRAEIMAVLKANSAEIKGFGVKKLGLFGSAVRGEAKEISDLDFLVEFEKKSFDSYMDLKFFLEDLFECKVDLVLNDSIKTGIKKPILEETVYAEGL